MKKLLAVTLCVILSISLFILPVSASNMDKLNELADIIKKYNLYSTDDDNPILAALERFFEENPDKFDEFADYMYQTYDTYSHYMPEEEYLESYPVATEYVGIGVELDDTRTGGNFVKTVFDTSPAQAAGMQNGDQIVSVDGIDVTNYTIGALSSIIRGVPDTDVVIGVKRDNLPNVKLLTITRKPITLSNIEFEDMGDGIAYIKITRFGDIRTFFDFVNIYNDLPNQGFKSVIFDVRSNPGGSLDVLYNILNYIIPEKDREVLSIYTRDLGHETYTSSGAGWTPNGVVVLVDQYSASAAEIFAGTLKGLGYADIVGLTTYGKGVGQIHQELEDGSVAIVTNFEIKLPGLESYNGKGIVPDYTVYWGTAPFPMPALSPLSDRLTLKAGDISPAVLQLEKRLQLLGYFNDIPDETFDTRTLYAAHAFAGDYGLRKISTVSGNLIYHLNQEIQKLKNSTISVDLQLEKALELSLKTAKNPLSY